MAVFNFLAGENFTIQDLGGSGLGAYGPGGFGSSVRVGEYQDNTYITDSTGAIAGPKADNVKWVHPNSGELAGDDVRVLRDIPNSLATLAIKFSHTTPVKVQNTQVRIFNRSNIDVPAVGVTVKVAELIHPWDDTSSLGSGDTSWSNLGGSGGVIGGVTYDAPLSLVDSPGVSGLSPSGTNTESTEHWWYLAVSMSPDTIGSKTQVGLYVETEYL